MDPYRILRVRPDATERELRKAWKQRAVTEHPDSGGSHERMTLINRALDTALKRLAQDTSSSGGQPQQKRDNVYSRRIATEMSSFTVSVLPVECWHALEVVASECGPTISSEPPYLLEFFLNDSDIQNGVQSWCRCDLVPEAGATTVHIAVGNAADGLTPELEVVRDYLVQALNRLDWNSD